MDITTFVLPSWYDITATFLFAIVGSLIAIKRGYDVIGVTIIAVISGAGGGIIRDAIFLNIMPAFITNWIYPTVIFIAVASLLLARSLYQTKAIAWVILIVDALGLGMYGIYGAQKADGYGLSIVSVLLVGTIAAVGGGILRDVMMVNKRSGFMPGQMYGFIAVIGIGLFLILSVPLHYNAALSAWIAIGLTFAIRILTVRFNWRTKAVMEYYDPSEYVVKKIKDVHIPTSELAKMPIIKKHNNQK